MSNLQKRPARTQVVFLQLVDSTETRIEVVPIAREPMFVRVREGSWRVDSRALSTAQSNGTCQIEDSPGKAEKRQEDLRRSVDRYALGPTTAFRAGMNDADLLFARHTIRGSVGEFERAPGPRRTYLKRRHLLHHRLTAAVAYRLTLRATEILSGR